MWLADTVERSSWVLYSQRHGGQALSLSHRGEQIHVWPPAGFAYRNSSLNRLLSDSAKLFWHGDPGSMQAVVMPLLLDHRRRAWAMNSGPLSLLM